MQKLFTMFPAGIPGIALILLRVSVAIGLWEPLIDSTLVPGSARVALLGLLSIFLLIGLATSLAGTMAVIMQLAAVDPPRLHAASCAAMLVCIATATSLALIGPGAFSLDARLFGRRVLTQENW